MALDFEPNHLQPMQEWCNPRKDIIFTWRSKRDQSHYQFGWRYIPPGGSPEPWQSTPVIKNEELRHVMPANTLTHKEGDVDWRVRVQPDDSSDFSKWGVGRIWLGVGEQLPPRGLAPVGDYVNAEQPITFKWKFVADADETQKSISLEYWIGTKGPFNEELSDYEESSKTVMVDDPEAGIGKWRIKTINNYDEESKWSEWFYFQVMATPPMPQITEVTDENRPLIKWRSVQQESYQVQIFEGDNIVYDSKRVISKSDRSFKVPFLKNGTYDIRLVIYNSYDIPSSPGQFSKKITKKEITPPNCILVNFKDGIRVASDSKNGEVFRDEKLIGSLEDGVFFDFTAPNKTDCEYYVRKWVNDSYVDSSIRIAASIFAGNTIAKLSEPEKSISLWQSSKQTTSRGFDFNVDAVSLKLSKSKYEVFEFDSIEKEIFDFVFVLNKSEIGNFKEMIRARESIILRTQDGDVIVGVVVSLSGKLFQESDAYSVSFSIQRTLD